MSRLCVAVDVGGTKIAAALVDADGVIAARVRRPTDAARGGQAVLASLIACIDELPLAAQPIAAIGVSAAGVIDPLRGTVADATAAMPGWKGQAIGAALRRRYAVPVACANDVHCALTGELWRNPALDGVAGSVVMLTLGTGLGGAIAVDGIVLAGERFLAGHFGRTLVAHQGGLATLDELVSGTGLAALYRATVGAGDVAGAADAARVLALAADGNAGATAALSAWLDHLSLQLHNIGWIFDPAMIVLGGGVIDGRAHWWPQLQERLARLGAGWRVAPAALGGDAGMIGAARLAWQAAAAVAAEAP